MFHSTWDSKEDLEADVKPIFIDFFLAQHNCWKLESGVFIQKYWKDKTKLIQGSM